MKIEVNRKLNDLFYLYHKNLRYKTPIQYLQQRGLSLQDLLAIDGGLIYLSGKEGLNFPLYNFENELKGFLCRKVEHKQFLYLPINNPPSKNDCFWD